MYARDLNHGAGKWLLSRCFWILPRLWSKGMSVCCCNSNDRKLSAQKPPKEKYYIVNIMPCCASSLPLCLLNPCEVWFNAETRSPSVTWPVDICLCFPGSDCVPTQPLHISGGHLGCCFALWRYVALEAPGGYAPVRVPSAQPAYAGWPLAPDALEEAQRAGPGTVDSGRSWSKALSVLSDSRF